MESVKYKEIGSTKLTFAVGHYSTNEQILLALFVYDNVNSDWTTSYTLKTKTNIFSISRVHDLKIESAAMVYFAAYVEFSAAPGDNGHYVF